jgi:acetyl esterase/lipase/predicted amidohydrolase
MKRPALILLMMLTSAPIVVLAQEANLDRQEDVIYGRKDGTALTLDVFTPEGNANGAGIVLVVSGGFFSSHEAINPGFVTPFLDRGYTVFAVVHGSQPRYTVPEIITDMNRAVRFIRHHADDYGISPDRIGITGASAGGHLSLMLGTAGTEGDPDAREPVDRQSSRVQAVACFFPPTDFLNFGGPGQEKLRASDHARPFRPAFDYFERDEETNLLEPITEEARLRQITADISPITHVSEDDPPTLIIHGDRDELVPLQQSEVMVEALEEAGVEAKLVVKEGAAHGWPTIAKDLESFADWFDEHLALPDDANETEHPATTSRADQPPRKVVIGTAIFGPYGAYPGILERLETLSGLIDEMAHQAEERFPGEGLDLAILPETVVTSGRGPASERAIPLDGPVRETFAGLARKHDTYIIAPMDLADDDPQGTTYTNAAVLFDRQGEVLGIYRKAHPVAVLGTDELEGGITPGEEYPVFDCDFGKLGIQICWDIQFEDGWQALADQGAEVVAWPSASPATVQPSFRAAANRYYVVSSTWREDATVFEPTGLVAAQVEGREEVLVHQIDLSYAILGWSAPLRNGEAFTEKFGRKFGFHYEPREDLGLFWSNDPAMTIGEMLRELGLEENDAQVDRNRRLQDAARGGPVARP